MLTTPLKHEPNQLLNTYADPPSALPFVGLGSHNLRFLFNERLGLNIYHDVVMGSDTEPNGCYTMTT
jgi:hypothetical protein